MTPLFQTDCDIDQRYEEEVRHAVKYEFAETVKDVIIRRLGISFLDRSNAIKGLKRISEIMSEEKKWSTDYKNQQMEDAKKLIETQHFYD